MDFEGDKRRAPRHRPDPENLCRCQSICPDCDRACPRAHRETRFLHRQLSEVTLTNCPGFIFAGSIINLRLFLFYGPVCDLPSFLSSASRDWTIASFMRLQTASAIYCSSIFHHQTNGAFCARYLRRHCKAEPHRNRSSLANSLSPLAHTAYPPGCTTRARFFEQVHRRSSSTKHDPLVSTRFVQSLNTTSAGTPRRRLTDLLQYPMGRKTAAGISTMQVGIAHQMVMIWIPFLVLSEISC